MAHLILIAFFEVFMANSPSFASGDTPRSPRFWPGEVPNPLSMDVAVWDHLKHAIAASSGFQSWELEGGADEALQTLSLDHRVQRYLRETLETLAY